jgi:predicted phage terminase large subunit-like protein
VRAALKNNATADGTQCRMHIPQDPGQAGKDQAQSLVKFLGGFSVQADPISGDKVTRAEPVASQVNVGNVMMLRAPWNDALKASLRVFPNGKHDDEVDALADAYNMHNGGNLGLFDFIKAQADSKAAAEEAERKALEADPNKGAGMGIIAAIRAQQ